jgi:XTP/dITP diphosphohydrolase
VETEEEVKSNWERLKMKEGKTSVLGGVPVSLPAMVKATRIQEKAKKVGFEWENKDQVWEKVEEETHELKSAIEDWQSAGHIYASIEHKKVEEEFGDLIFSLINYARFLRVDAENALEVTNKKFIRRFTQMEEEATQSGKDLTDMTLMEMDSIWNSIKKRT